MRRVVIVSALIIVCAAVGLWYFAPREIAPLRKAVDSGFSAVEAAVGAGSQADAKPAPGGPRGVAVVTAVATTADFPIRRYAIGFVSSPAVVDVSARISSQVDDVHVKDGQMVKAGDLLFTLDDRALKAQLAKDQAMLAKDQALQASAEADLKRASDLMARQTGTKQAFDQADAASKAAVATVAADQATIDADKVQLSYATIKAPITGRLGAIKITKGNLVSTGNNSNSSPLVTITQMDPLEATFSLPETDLPLLRKALASPVPASVRLYRDGDKMPLGTGMLEFVDSTVDQASGTVQVKASMPNKDLNLWPGQFVDVVLDAGKMPEMVSIPTVAVQPGQNGSFVYVVGPDNKVEERPVEIALTQGENSAIAKGIKSGERVVTDGQTRLKQGTLVRLEAGKGSAGASRKMADDLPGDSSGQ